MRPAVLLLAAWLAAGAGSAQAAATLDLDIPAGELWTGLQRLARDSGQRVLVPAGSSALREVWHPALRGRMSLTEALDRLLEGSRFRWQHASDGTIEIVALTRAEATLDRLQIDGTAPAELPEATPGGWVARLTPQGESPISRLEGARLEAVPVRSFTELLRRAPNVSGQGEGMTIRGIERGAAATATSNVYLDGIPIGARVLDMAALPVLQRADYRRGPRAIPDGLGAMAGVIRLETMTPRPENELRGELSWLTAGGAGVRAEMGGMLGEGSTLGRLSLADQRQPGRIDNPYTGQSGVDARRQRLLHGRMLYEPDSIESLSVRSSVLSLRADPGLQSQLVGVRAFDPWEELTFDLAPRERRLRADGGALEAEWRATDVDTFLGFVQGSRTELRTDTLLTEPTERLRHIEREALTETGIRWMRELDQGWRVRAGVDASRREGVQSEAQITPLAEFFPPSLPVQVSPDTSREVMLAARHRLSTRGIFAEVGWRRDRFEVTAGLRRIDERRESLRQVRTRLTSEDCVLTLSDQPPFPCSLEFPSDESLQHNPSRDGLALPHLQFLWETGQDHRWSVEWRRGFVAGGTMLDTTSGVLAPYSSERSDTLDLGWSWDSSDRRWRMGATVFYNRWYDRHVPLDLPMRESHLTVNAGKAHAYGGELEARWMRDEALEAWFGIGLLQTRYDVFQTVLVSGPVDLSGREFPGAPHLTLSSGVMWRPWQDWQFGLTGWYGSRAFSDALNTTDGIRAGHAVFDLAARHSIGPRTSVAMAVRNAFDRRYLEDVRVAGVVPRPREYLTGRRRELELSLAWAW